MKIKTIKNCDRFTTPENACKYPAEFRKGHFNDNKETNAILRSFEYIPNGARVLDLPCGTGRVTRLLIRAGFNIAAVDRSLEMVKVAQKNLNDYQTKEGLTDAQVEYFQEDVVAGTSFNDDEFNAVICHRLFHHLVEAESRMSALKELKRLTTGQIIFSFFNSFSFSACARLIKNKIKGYKPTDRIPINKKIIMDELEGAGMECLDIIYKLKGISPLCLIVVQRK